MVSAKESSDWMIVNRNGHTIIVVRKIGQVN